MEHFQQIPCTTWRSVVLVVYAITRDFTALMLKIGPFVHIHGVSLFQIKVHLTYLSYDTWEKLIHASRHRHYFCIIILFYISSLQGCGLLSSMRLFRRRYSFEQSIFLEIIHELKPWTKGRYHRSQHSPMKCVSRTASYTGIQAFSLCFGRLANMVSAAESTLHRDLFNLCHLFFSQTRIFSVCDDDGDRDLPNSTLLTLSLLHSVGQWLRHCL